MNFNSFYFYLSDLSIDSVPGAGCSQARLRREKTIMDAARYLPFAGRLLIALTFAVSGFGKLADYSTTVGVISASKLPAPAPLSYAAAVAVEIVCAAMLVVGFQARVAAAILALYCVATAVFFHADFANPDNIFHFMKNVAMTGGLLQIVGFGAGAFSIDNRREIRSSGVA
jgi:putative oxidoreductase